MSIFPVIVVANFHAVGIQSECFGWDGGELVFLLYILIIKDIFDVI